MIAREDGGFLGRFRFEIEWEDGSTRLRHVETMQFGNGARARSWSRSWPMLGCASRTRGHISCRPLSWKPSSSRRSPRRGYPSR
jgi:hypothetical protein